MTTSHKITVGLAFLLFTLLICVGYGWEREHEASLVVIAQQKDDAAAAARIEEQEKNNQAQLASALHEYALMKHNVQTPAQVVQALPQVINLPAPIVQVTPAQAQAQAVADASLPDAPRLSAGDLVIPQVSVKSFYDSQVDCKINAAKVTSCAQTVADLNAVMAVDRTEISQLQTALKGGTKWQRVKRSLKAVGIGTLIGAGTVAYLDHR